MSLDEFEIREKANSITNNLQKKKIHRDIADQARQVARTELSSKFKMVYPYHWNGMLLSMVGCAFLGVIGGAVFHYYASPDTTPTMKEVLKRPAPVEAAEKNGTLSRQQIAALYLIEKNQLANLKELVGSEAAFTFDHVYEVAKMLNNKEINENRAWGFLEYMFDDNAKRFSSKDIDLARKAAVKIKEDISEHNGQKAMYMVCGALLAAFGILGGVIAKNTIQSEKNRRKYFKEVWEKLLKETNLNIRNEIYKTFEEAGIPVKGRDKFDKEFINTKRFEQAVKTI